MCDEWTREVEDVGTSGQARHTTKKAPQPTVTAGAKEIKVPYLFDERFDTALPLPPLPATGRAHTFDSLYYWVKRVYVQI